MWQRTPSRQWKTKTKTIPQNRKKYLQIVCLIIGFLRRSTNGQQAHEKGPDTRSPPGNAIQNHRYHCTPTRMAGIKKANRTSLAVQQLRLWASNARGAGLIPGQGTKILHAAWHSQSQKIKVISEDVEKLKPSCVAGRSVKWFTHFGKEFCPFKG